jgi:hypothetical protein
MRHSFWRALLAVLMGNLIYFSVQPYLPYDLQHHLYQIDWGLALDFIICVICYLLIRLIR